MGVRGSHRLPARRETITLRTAGGLSLVGEVALPLDKDPVATLLCLHPLPTHGGMMDSHLFRKASYRLPALADLAVVRFNTRGTASDHGRSEGEFGEGMAERHDVAAAIAWCVAAGLPRLWLGGGGGCGGWAGGRVRNWGSGGETPGGGGARPGCPRRCAGPVTQNSARGPRRASRCWCWCRSSTTTSGRRRRGPGSRGCR